MANESDTPYNVRAPAPSNKLVNDDGLVPPAAWVDENLPKPELPPSIKEFQSSDNRDNVNWIRQAFMLNTMTSGDIKTSDMARRISTTASWKYVDTALGGNWPINSPPQFTEFSDIAMGGARKFNNAPGRTIRYTADSFGMGRYYSEVIDDHAQLVTMAFGVQAFNSLSNFFGNFYHSDIGSLVRTGRISRGFYLAGKVLGSLVALPFLPLFAGSNFVKQLMNIPATKYSYFKPTMPLYWNTVNLVVNAITANMGVHYRQLSPAQKLMYNDPNDVSDLLTSTDFEKNLGDLESVLPNVFSSYKDSQGNVVRGNIDVYAVASRAQRLADQNIQRVQKALDEKGSIKNLRNSMINALSSDMKLSKPVNTSDKLNDYLNSASAKPSDGKEETMESFADSKEGALASIKSDSKEEKHSRGRVSSWFVEAWKTAQADLHDGVNYITFRTNYNGSIGESFTNSMRESDIAQKVNSMASTARSARYNFAGGNLLSGSIGGLVQGAIDSVTGALSGILEGVHLSGLAGVFTGTAFADIPRMYDNSDVQLPSESYTVELRAWSGNKISLMQNIYIPLACLLAGALPRSTGPQSYGTPFTCQMFSRGRQQVKSGMITDLSITRGVGNVGWTEDGLPLGIDVTFTVTDFTAMMHMPIMAAGGILGTLDTAVSQGVGAALGGASGGNMGEALASTLIAGTYQDDTAFNDYLAVLAGLDFQSQMYPTQRISLMADRYRLNYDTLKSPGRAAAWFSGTLVGRTMQGFVHGTDRP